MILKLSVCTFLSNENLQALTKEVLQDGAYEVVCLDQAEAFIDYVSHNRQEIDCLILEETTDSGHILEHLQETEIFLPSVVLLESTTTADTDADTDSVQAPQIGGVYDAAVFYLSRSQLDQLRNAIDQVINQFLKLPPSCTLKDNPQATNPAIDEKIQVSFLLQQKRLAQKLKERLGYLSIYYKRNPDSFLRRMKPEEREAFLARLKLDYRKIVLNYFSGDTSLNQKIDNYVSALFFADAPISQVVEIHMELMDDFSKQLKIEGRSEEILLDYRLTLIDTLANLCEMYRRSVPREP